MDPLPLEALRFGVAILAGGIVAVIAQRLAFAHAQRLAADDARHRRDAAIRALAHEIDENLERIGQADRRAPTNIERSAWDLARGLDLPTSIFDAARKAYAIGADLNLRIAIVDSLLGRGQYADPNADWGRQAARHHDAQVDEMLRTGARAREAFEMARDALKGVR